MNNIVDAIAKYDLAKQQERNFDKEEIKELRIILATLCMNQGELHVYDRDRALFRNNKPTFEWHYDAENRRHTLRLKDE